jgi:hypothetical protein
MLFFEYLREFKQNLGYASGGHMSSIREKKPDAKNLMLLSILTMALREGGNDELTSLYILT